jgi:GNAT superfamily N-acetyltransferase
MRFELLAQTDLQEVSKLQPPDWTDIIPHLKYYIESDFCHTVKVITDDQITGIGTLILYAGSAWLAHIIVDPGFRNHGIGTKIVEELLYHPLRKLSEPVLLSATPSGEAVYRKLGFKPVNNYVFLTRERSWNNFNISERIEPFKESFRTGILELDKRISGENRQNLLSPELHKSFIYVNCSAVEGFFLPAPGEGTVIAETSEAGLELLKLKHAIADDAVLPEENETGIAFLKANGFKQTDKKALRMILGNNVDWQPQNIFSRIGGNFG